jgi:hypothetical protein
MKPASSDDAARSTMPEVAILSPLVREHQPMAAQVGAQLA